MSLAKITRTVKNLLDAWDLVTFTILGKMRGGKTSLARLMARELLKDGWVVRYVPHSTPKNVSWVFKPIPEDKPGLLVILDDMSFMFTNVLKPEVQRFEKEVSEAAHLAGIHGTEKKVLIIFIFHYIKAIPPFFRNSYIKALVGPITFMEKKILAGEKWFRPKDLSLYIDMVVKYVMDKEERERRLREARERWGGIKARPVLIDYGGGLPFLGWFPVLTEPDLMKFYDKEAEENAKEEVIAEEVLSDLNIEGIDTKTIERWLDEDLKLPWDRGQTPAH